MISTKQANAIPSTLRYVAPGDARRQADRREAALHGTDDGDPVRLASVAAETMIDSTTATTAPGTLGQNRLNPSDDDQRAQREADRRHAGVRDAR